jgi:thioredoxin-dependent peroxiredoxin
MKLHPDDLAPSFSVETCDGHTVALEQFAGKPLLLMFHRYAGCPMCNIRLHTFAQRFPELQRQGLEAIAFFHSSPEEIRKHAGGRQYPFAIATDPKFRVYRKYGVETSWLRLAMALIQPSAYADYARAFAQGFRGGRMPRQLAKMPADFFIGPDGRIQAVHYGTGIANHMSMSTIEENLQEFAPASEHQT